MFSFVRYIRNDHGEETLAYGWSEIIIYSEQLQAGGKEEEEEEEEEEERKKERKKERKYPQTGEHLPAKDFILLVQFPFQNWYCSITLAKNIHFVYVIKKKKA